VPDGDDVFFADKDVDLAKVDLLDVVTVLGGPKHEEQALAVVFQFGALMPGERVFNGQGVKVEFLAAGLQFGGILPLAPDPRHPLALPQH
jgi:hypothetical protein